MKADVLCYSATFVYKIIVNTIPICTHNFLFHLNSSLQQLHSFYSEKQLGCINENENLVFRLFAPRAHKVQVIFFEEYNHESGAEFPMKCDENGVWEFSMPLSKKPKYYGYRVFGNEEKPEHFDSSVIIADPYSHAVVTHNTHRHSAKSIIIDTSYDWSDDTYVTPADHTTLIIYECHVRDMTAHASSGIAQRGTYKGFVEPHKKGGISYLKNLGINAVELLPVQEFSNLEPPYNLSETKNVSGTVNTWNPYSRNHWGYMTSFFFAPESYYASDGNLTPNEYSGIYGNAVRELKDMIKQLHKENIAVILDIVFNHVSHYDENPLKFCDKFYYFHCNENGEFISTSGCGNDFRTESPMSRKLILDCIKYWIEEYNVDGFRFDLASMIDTETCRQIIQTAQSLKPNIILIAEPWGGGKYDIERYAQLGWKAWNDLFRNAIKGQNPYNEQGLIFGQLQGNNSAESLETLLKSSSEQKGFPFPSPIYSVNYLESHDDMTIGDFIRIASNEVQETKKILDREVHCRLTPQQMKYNKLAALLLFVSQGIIMIHEGQEFARSKVIQFQEGIDDDYVQTMDHNSYNKDNATNYLNYTDSELNKELWSYYKGLISLRKKFSRFFGKCKAENSTVRFSEANHRIELLIKNDVPSEKYSEALVLINVNDYKQWKYSITEGEWDCFVNEDSAEAASFSTVSKVIIIPPISGMILLR